VIDLDVSRKLGPLPLWAWAAIGVGGAFLVRRQMLAGSVGVSASYAGGDIADTITPDYGRVADHNRTPDRSEDDSGGGSLYDNYSPLALYRGGLLGDPVGFASGGGGGGGGGDSSGGGGTVTKASLDLRPAIALRAASTDKPLVFGGATPPIIARPGGR
jgi:hypothetical protein